MPNRTKIATCCYCGTRAALVLVGDARHELACANCGAPLSELKMLRAAAAPNPASSRAYPTRHRGKRKRRDWSKARKPKRRQSLSRMFMRELRKASDDFFDDVFDIFD